jgi:hypothetical protein
MAYTIALCEIFNRNIHGYDTYSTSDIDQRILASYTFTPEEFMDPDEWMPLIENMRIAYSQYSPTTKSHPSIRNYRTIVENPDYYKLDIVQLEEMPGGETCAVIKTGGIKTLQKKWRKHLAHQRNLIRERSEPQI